MEDKYIITIVGTQTVEGEDDRIEVITTGSLEITEEQKVIRYTEYDTENPLLKTDTTVTLERNGKLTIDRKGETKSELILEPGVRHQCHYETPMGPILIGVFTSVIKDTLTEEGGELRAKYDLDFFSDIVSTNEFHISLKKKQENSGDQ